MDDSAAQQPAELSGERFLEVTCPTPGSLQSN